MDAGEIGVGEEFFQQLFRDYGPLALGWGVAGLLWWRFIADAKAHRDDLTSLIRDYRAALESVRVSIVENTKVTERFTTLLDERTRH